MHRFRWLSILGVTCTFGTFGIAACGDDGGGVPPNPPDAASFASNWELSLSRALTVAVKLEQSGYRFPVIARGHGDSRFDEIAAALAPAEREALARRVDIIVYEEAS